MRALIIGVALVGLAACTDGPSRSFTWLDGNQYRWLNDPSVCTDDGSAVFFQKAKGGMFAEPANLTEAKCVPALSEASVSFARSTPKGRRLAAVTAAPVP